MTRYRLLATLVFALSLSIPALAIQAPPPTPADLDDRTQLQHQKLVDLLEAFREIEIALQKRVEALQNTYGAIETTNLYQGIDLSTIDGIQRARQRVKSFESKYVEFSAAVEQRWAAIETAVRNSNLAEPEASELRKNLAADLTRTLPATRAWISALHAEAAAVIHFLGVAERHLGHTRWQDQQLLGTDSRTSHELRAAQREVAAAEQRDLNTGPALRSNPNHVVTYVLSALRELHKTMRRPDNT